MKIANEINGGGGVRISENTGLDLEGRWTPAAFAVRLNSGCLSTILTIIYKNLLQPSKVMI